MNSLYRGKTIEKPIDWFYGDKVTELSTGRVFILDVNHIDKDTKFYDLAVEVLPESVGMWTGLNDKNSKKIFEGDIVKVTVHNDSEIDRPDLWHKCIVKFGDGEVDASDYEQYSIDIIGFYLDDLKSNEISNSILEYRYIEIIGNTTDKERVGGE